MSTANKEHLKCFAVKLGRLKDRIDVKFYLLGGHEILSLGSAPLGSLVVQEPDYGSGARSVPMSNAKDVKYIRITDFDDEGIPPNHEFVTAAIVEDSYRLEEEDVLFARSGATVGKTYIHSAGIGPAIFAGYCIRFRFDFSKVLPKFVYYYSKTIRYKSWVKSIQRPSGQPNINKEEFKSFTIPLPLLDVQRNLVNDMETALQVRRKKLRQADELLGSLDWWLLNTLGLATPPIDDRVIFAVRSAQISSSQRLNPDYFHPERLKAIGVIKSAGRNLQPARLADLAEFRRDVSKTASGQYYLGLAHIQSHTGELIETNEEAEGQCFHFQENDVLFARLRPYLNKVYRAERAGVCSTEFHVIRAKNSAKILPDYLAVMLRSRLILAQTRHMMTGNTHPRLTNDDVVNLIVPVPSLKVQQVVALEVSRRRKKAQQLRAEVEAEWENAKISFEENLLDNRA